MIKILLLGFLLTLVRRLVEFILFRGRWLELLLVALLLVEVVLHRLLLGLLLQLYRDHQGVEQQNSWRVRYVGGHGGAGGVFLRRSW